MSEENGGMVLCCLLWAAPGQAAALTAYEDAVLALVTEHGGDVVQRARGDGADGAPHEVQFIRFGSSSGFDAFLADSRRTMLSTERDRVVARTELFPVSLR